MNLRIQIRHDAAPERMQNFIKDEFARLQEKYENVMTSAEFILDQQGPTGHVKTVDAIIHVVGDTLTVKESSDEMHKSIDTAMKVLEKLLQRHKETHVRVGPMIRHNVNRENNSEIS